MKLIDLLVPEFNKSGGWPKTLDSAVRMKLPCGYWTKELNGTLYFTDKSSNHRIYKGEYEAALAASKQVSWSGDGLPAEGIECEVKSGKDSWTLCKVVHSSSSGVAFIYLEEPSGESPSRYIGVLDCIPSKHADGFFRPIRTEAERNREEAETELRCCLAGTGAGITRHAAKHLYDAISAGKIPGIRLE